VDGGKGEGVVQMKKINTPEFERWFGDSKVVDESGEPLVVYHGTSKDKPFSSFTRNAQGTWFTSSPEAASSYAMTNDSQKVVYEGGKYVSKNTSSHVIPVYLSIQNPLMVEGELLEKWRRAVNYRAANKMMVAQAKYAGHDGLVFRDGVFVVFEPTQIKSAIGNKGTFDPEDSNITNPYTRPDLRERLKRKIMAGSKGGNPGQWSARKAQLLAAEYEKAGGGYTGKRSASQRSLSKWTKEDWRTKSGKPSLETGERYLPAAAITALTSAEYAETSRAKRKATGQFSRQPKRIAMKTREYSNPMDPRSAKTQIATTVDTYRKASKMLGGNVIDYGAGLGLGTDALRSEGLLADSFEPYPDRWQGKRPPTYTDSANIPSDSYDSLVSFSVINVVEPDVRKFLFQEVARILRPDGVALITGRTRQDVGAAKIKTPHLEEGGYLIGADQRYQKGFTQAELERYAKEVLGPGFTVEANRALNGASIKITKGKANPAKRNAVRSKLSRIIEPGDRILCYDTASGEDFYRLWDVIHTAMPMTKEALVEVEGMLDDDGVLVIESGETPAGLQDHFRRATRYNGLLLVQGPKNPEQARIETEKLRRELE
jgi:SAM-dependent methyltransferase